MEDKKREQIKREAKQILDKFSKALANIGNVKEVNVERDKDKRSEGEGVQSDEEFREIMFENAPQKKKDFIVAERKTW